MQRRLEPAERVDALADVGRHRLHVVVDQCEPGPALREGDVVGGPRDELQRRSAVELPKPGGGGDFDMVGQVSAQRAESDRLIRSEGADKLRD